MLDDPDLQYKIALSLIRGMNRIFADEIIGKLSDVGQFFKLDSRELVSIFGAEASQFRSDVRAEAMLKAQSEIGWLKKTHSVLPVFYADPDYPKNLFECEDAPLMLYVAGNLQVLSAQRIIGMVGTRNATLYGETFIGEFLPEISNIDSNILIVSGLAYGIDIMSHRGAMSNNLPTAAVVAHGLSTIYPASHRGYARQIIGQGGAIVTEYVHDAPVHRANFLARNRIIAGLANCVIVVESDIKGGAIATATNANDYGRDVFAVPGRYYDRYSSGCNSLIFQNKAAILTDAADFAGAMKWSVPKKEGKQVTMEFGLPAERQRIVDYVRNMELKKESYSINRMAVDLGITVSDLNRLASQMEFDGQIVRLAGGKIKVLLH